MLHMFVIASVIGAGLGQECGQNFKLSPGEKINLSSKLLNNGANSGDYCAWTFTLKSTSKVSVSCENVNIGSFENENCLENYVKINDKTFCGAVSISEEFEANEFEFLFKKGTESNKIYDVSFECHIRSELIQNLDKHAEFAPKGAPPPIKERDCNCKSTSNNERIVGGTDANAQQYPYLASLRFKENFVFCGASLISSFHVITAAHCVEKFSKDQFRVYLGNTLRSMPDSTTHSYGVSEIIIHEDYNPQGVGNDIAIIVLAQQVEFSSATLPLCLPNGGHPEDIDNKEVKVAGWGTLKYQGAQPDHLQVVELKGIPWKSCQERFVADILDPTMVCAFAPGKDACQGDSGGPLVLEEDGVFYQYGIVSFGIECASEYPGVYSSVVKFLNWIYENVGDVCMA